MRRRCTTLAATIAALALAACSDTTFRHDTITTVEVDGQDVDVSWVRMEPTVIDMMVTAEGGGEISSDLALRAAMTAASEWGVCGSDDVKMEGAPVTFVRGRHAFRLHCVDPS